MANNENSSVTRRGFFKRSAGLLSTAAILASSCDAKDTQDSDKNERAAKTGSATIPGKIALEEHFALPEAGDTDYNIQPTPGFQLQMQDMGEKRIAEMDRGG